MRLELACRTCGDIRNLAIQAKQNELYYKTRVSFTVVSLSLSAHKLSALEYFAEITVIFDTFWFSDNKKSHLSFIFLLISFFVSKYVSSVSKCL